MEIIYFKEIESTQKYLLDHLIENICIWSEYQTKGIGSRGNSWVGEKGNLFFSFSLNKNDLPKDLKLQSISIYYMFLLKEVLNGYGSKVKFKWPNDLYLDKKVGGCISNLKNDIIIVGIGLNTKSSIDFNALDIKIENETILYDFLGLVNKNISWSDVYKKLEKEFYANKFIMSNNLDLSKAKLNFDGSIELNNERIYSLR
ncbi:MAG: biotin--[acetyl-CoA-carboxylase] ligase [Nautilia sp.]|nr:MAG: biotin--[acetyl-CoA-carboxylase] ligase [Nautilia sp.]